MISSMGSSAQALKAWMRNTMTTVSTKPKVTVCPSESSGFFIFSPLMWRYEIAAILAAGPQGGNPGFFGKGRNLAHNPKISTVAQLVRRHDRDRFVTALFAAPGRREALFALYAFNYEVARIREAVSEPLLGSIRLQWWREVIREINEGKPPRQHEVAEALAASFGRYQLWGTEI